MLMLLGIEVTKITAVTHPLSVGEYLQAFSVRYTLQSSLTIPGRQRKTALPEECSSDFVLCMVLSEIRSLDPVLIVVSSVLTAHSPDECVVGSAGAGVD